MAKLPFMKWFTGDWKKDPAVCLCSPATRGVWFDLLCAMHDAGRVGSLSGTRDQLATIGRCVPADFALVLTELQTTGTADVTERNGVVTVTNRRMRRESQSREANRLRQQRFRSQDSDNGDVTHKLPSDPEYDGDLPSVLESLEFRAQFGQWLAYKIERGDEYTDRGLKTLVSRAAKLAAKHGLPAICEAMERAIANQWQGWDHPSAFNGRQPKQTSERPGHTYDPDATKRDPNVGRM